MLSANLALSRRLERAEGHACAQFAEARKRLFPECGSEWMECAGTYAVFDGVDSPVTQTFGLGVFEQPDADSLDRIEQFFAGRGAAVQHEVSPHAGLPTFELLCARNYRPIEISNVVYQVLGPDKPITQESSCICVRTIGAQEAELWTRVHAQGWSHEHPEIGEFLLQIGSLLAVRKQTVCFLAEIGGKSGAAGALAIHEGVALLAGSATIREFRRRGLQNALLSARLRYAREQGCDLAMMVAEAGSESQRNAERQGFQIAYTRMKWQLSFPEWKNQQNYERVE